MSILLILLAVVGLTVSTYFTAVAFHWIAPDTRWIPTVCRMDDKTCASVIFTPSARVFGPPNSLQLSIATQVILLLHIAEHMEEPFQVPISKYLASFIEHILL